MIVIQWLFLYFVASAFGAWVYDRGWHQSPAMLPFYYLWGWVMIIYELLARGGMESRDENNLTLYLGWIPPAVVWVISLLLFFE